MTDLFAEIIDADLAMKAVGHGATAKQAQNIVGLGIAKLALQAASVPPTSRAGACAFAPACNVLALDLGTHCGWATANRDGAMDYGTEKFHRLSGGAKWAGFRSWLSALIAKHGIEVLYFEDVKNHAGVLAAHAYGGFLAMAQMVCHQHNVRMVGVGVKQAKKAWTGNGNANKSQMVAAAQVKGFRVSDTEDDTADALAILFLAVKQEQP